MNTLLRAIIYTEFPGFDLVQTVCVCQKKSTSNQVIASKVLLDPSMSIKYFLWAPVYNFLE